MTGRRSRRIYGPKRKPGPKCKPRVLLQDRDYYCGICAGKLTLPCDVCVDGCGACAGTGEKRCWGCFGGATPIPPPEWMPDTLSETPQPPRCHHAESGEKPVPGGLGERAAEASRLADDSTPES